ncbi:class I SAM-dependent methyltransferase [Streptomyces mirabilis]|nr:class I SAM-dependent methyltransferase [Streptomyces mirabilis]
MSTSPDGRTSDTASHQTTSASEFDRLFGAEGHDSSFSTIARLVDPDLPPDLDLFSFLCSDLLHHIAHQLDLRPQQTLADLGCGRGGPGLWLASRAHAALIGIDFSQVAIAQARHRAAPHGSTRPSPWPTSPASPDRPMRRPGPVAGRPAVRPRPRRRRPPGPAHPQARRPPGAHRLAPAHPGDERLPPRHRHADWTRVLHTAGFTDVHCASTPAWDDVYQGIYRTALTLHAEPGSALTGLQGEARRRPPTAHLLRRVAVTAVRD